MDDETNETTEEGNGQLDGFEGADVDKTALGFGGQTISRRLVIGDELYLLMKVEIVSDGRSKKKEDNGELLFKAGGSTTVLAELSAADAANVASKYR